MTTYILTGGNDRATPGCGERLRTAVRGKITEPARILSCLFAIPREDWERQVAGRETWFKQVFGDDTSMTLAFPQEFVRQAREHNIVYIHGGDDALLGHYLNHTPNITELFAGKVVVGSSAGANWLSRAYYMVDWRGVYRGSGIVPLNIMVHYESAYGKDDPRGPIDWAKARAELQAFIGAEQTITPLREGEFVVVEA